MRIRWLRITGIGPFAGQHTIDFSAFEDSGLFLLDGPTGSGKSTIIDAITFALYGDVARTKDASKERLRSNHIGDGAPSEADLVFEVAAGIFRVSRTPAYTPAGKKSPRSSRCSLTRVVEDADAPDGWRIVEAIASGPRDVGLEIPQIVGLDKDQFLQTIVLPQGKFSQFLTATSEAREGILRDIFDTQVYVDFTRTLTEAAASSKREIELARTQAVSAFDSMRALEAGTRGLGEAYESSQDSSVYCALRPDTSECDVDLIDVDGLDAGAEDSSNVLRWSDVARDRARLVHELACERAQTLALEAQAAARRLADGHALALDQAEHARTSARLQELEQAEPDVAREKLRAGAARRALAVAPHARAEESARERLAQAAELVASLAAGFDSEEGVGLTRDALSPTAVSALRRRARDAQEGAVRARGALAEVLALEASVPGMDEQILSLEQDLQEVEARIASLEASRDVLPDAVSQAERSLAVMRGDADLLPESIAQLRLLDERLEASTQADLLRAALPGAAQDLREAIADAKFANAAAADAHDLWVSQTASLLAESLEEGVACPVCGSDQHPCPARPGRGQMTRDEVSRLDEARDAAEARLREARATHADLVRRIGELNDTAGACTPELESLREAAAARVGVLEALKPQIASLEEDLTQVRAQLEATVGNIARERETRAGIASTLEERCSARARAQARVESERRGEQSLSERAACLDERARLADALARSCSRWEEARDTHEDARRLLDDALAAQELEAHSWRDNLLPLADLEDIEERVDAHDKDIFAARAALASPRLTRAAAAPSPDVEELERLSQCAEHDSAEATRASGKIEQHCVQLEAAHAALTRALARLGEARAQAGPIRRLADIAAASGPQNLAATPLASWVLISRLEDVLAAANPRLAAISSGRYELVAVPEDGTSSRKSGLGLALLDHDTDVLRSPRTLSGGETFYTSLALALGLADVVSAEAGGVELRTMFIDEGFGSLDSHTLALVMAQLHALRHAGRTVGVISHVEEMATQIPDQIQVRALAEGGSTLRVRA